MKKIISKLAAVVAVSVVFSAGASTDYRKMALPEPEEEGAAPLGTKWHKDNSEKLALYANILYEQARLIEGLPVEDPIAYAKAVCSLLV